MPDFSVLGQKTTLKGDTVKTSGYSKTRGFTTNVEENIERIKNVYDTVKSGNLEIEEKDVVCIANNMINKTLNVVNKGVELEKSRITGNLKSKVKEFGRIGINYNNCEERVERKE